MGSIRAVSNIEQAEERFSIMMMLPGNKPGVADGDIRTEELGWHALTFLLKGIIPSKKLRLKMGRGMNHSFTNTMKRTTPRATYGYDQYRPTYYLGYKLAKDSRFKNMEGDKVEGRVRRIWDPAKMDL